MMEAAVGFEPTNNGFANRRLRPLGYAAIAMRAAWYRRCPPLSIISLLTREGKGTRVDKRGEPASMLV